MYMIILWKVKNTRAVCFYVNQKKNAVVTLLYRFYQSTEKNKAAAAT